LLRRGRRIDFDLRPSLAPRSRLAETAAVFLGFPDFDSAVGKGQSRTEAYLFTAIPLLMKLLIEMNMW